MTVKANPAIHAVTLSTPINGADGVEITTVTVQRPTVGALRGLQLSLVQMQDVNALCKLLPRVTQPALSPDQIDNLDPADFAAMTNIVSIFFMTPGQQALVMQLD